MLTELSHNNFLRCVDRIKQPRAKSSKVKPKPRYGKVMDSPLGSARSDITSFDDTVSIRDSVYMEWYAARIATARKEAIEKKNKQKEEVEKQKKVR